MGIEIATVICNQWARMWAGSEKHPAQEVANAESVIAENKREAVQ
jgi:hypothetical protein